MLLRFFLIPMCIKRKIILKVPVDLYRTEEFISEIEREFHQPGTKTIFSVNPEKIMCAQNDLELFSALKETNFLIPDGIGTIFSLWLNNGIRISRTTGISLMQRILDLADKKKLKVFLFGSRPQVNKMASESILKRYPSLDLVGRRHGYIPEEEYDLLVERINSLKTDILFVGLGSPKQEKWIHNYKKSLKVKICMGVGGSLDVIAGRTSRAPLIFQTLGLEWLYRLMREPARFKRQIVLPKFVLEVLKEKISS